MFGPDLLGDRAHGFGQLSLHPLVDGLADALGHVVPELWVLALHDLLDEVADVVARGGEDVLGDLLGLELGVELGRAAQLGDPLVHRDGAHLGRAGGG